MVTITIYSTPTCHFCHLAKEYFKAQNLPYTEKDVATDVVAQQEMLEKSGGQLAVPVIDINGKIVIGFDQREVAALIAAAQG